MGGGQSRSIDMAGKPVVVIVGGGYGGIECAKALEGKANCVLIDRKDYFFHNVGALRGSTTDFEKAICIPYDKLLKTGSVIKGDVTNITSSYVEIFGHEEKIKFDFLVLATGTSYAFPAKIPFDSAMRVSEMYKDLRANIVKSKTILVIGGGPVGIELAGEISLSYQDKKIFLVHSGNRLLSSRDDLDLKLSQKLLELLKKTGVEVLLNERVDLSSLGESLEEANVANSRYLLGPISAMTVSGVKIPTDLVFFCNGSHINCSSYQEALKKAGEIHVNEYMQVETPRLIWKHIFAIGDCCDADKKVSFAARLQGNVVARNILASISKTPMKSYSKVESAMLVPIGPEAGAGQIPYFGVIGSMLTSMMKGKDLFATKAWQSLGYPGPPQEFLIQTGEKNDEEKKKNLIAAFQCTEEEAEKIQNQMLPAREVENVPHL